MLGFFAVLIAGVYGAVVVLVYLGQSALLYFPTRDIYATPDRIGLVYESVQIRTGNGVALHGWYLPAEKPRGTLLFFHGNAGNITHRLDSLQIFNELALNVLIFDYRGYGRSEGRVSEQGTYLDARAALDYLTRREGVAASEIIYFGRSLGGAIAAELAVEHPPAKLIVESTFTSVPDLGAELYPFLPVRLMSRFRYSTRDALERVRSPVLVVHSRDDEIIPMAHARALYAAAKEPKAFLEIRGDHNTGFLQDREAYREGLAQFLKAGQASSGHESKESIPMPDRGE